MSQLPSCTLKEATIPEMRYVLQNIEHRHKYVFESVSEEAVLESLQLPGFRTLVRVHGEIKGLIVFNYVYHNTNRVMATSFYPVEGWAKSNLMRALRISRSMHEACEKLGTKRFVTCGKFMPELETWHTHMGYHIEGIHPKAGMNGETWATYARVRY